MNTRQLSYILSIAETGSLSAAAKELAISQPALSKYLSELEEELGTELFLRHKKHLYPTSAGKVYLDAAKRIIAVKEQTYQMIAELSGGYQKTITIGVTPLRGSIAIARIFTQFHRRYPNVKIEMKEHYMAGLRTTRSIWHSAPAMIRRNRALFIPLFTRKTWFSLFHPSIRLPIRPAGTSRA